MPADPEEAPGWAAIDGALEPIYGSEEPPFHYAPSAPAFLSNDPLNGISVYKSNAFGRDHWHFITYGFSELYDKETDDPSTSGYGFELTIRVARDASEAEPSPWTFNFLQNLGRYVFSSGNVFEPGHYMNLNSPIAIGSETKIRGIAFMAEPELPKIATPNGSVEFIQIVGITEDEIRAIKRWDGRRFIESALEKLAGGVTDLARDSLLEDEEFARVVEARAEAEGSSTAILFPSVAHWQQHDGRTTVTLGANGVRDLVEVFPRRLRYGRDLTIMAGNTAIRFAPADQPAVDALDQDNLDIHITPKAAEEVQAAVRPVAGTYRFPSIPDVEIVVERSPIKDRDGNVVEWIG